MEDIDIIKTRRILQNRKRDDLADLLKYSHSFLDEYSMSGNLRRAAEIKVRATYTAGAIIWMKLVGIFVVEAVQNLSERKRLTNSAYTICRATYRSGATIGTTVIAAAHRRNQLDTAAALSARCAAAVVAAMRRVAALPFAANIRRPIVTTLWDCAWFLMRIEGVEGKLEMFLVGELYFCFQETL